MMVLLWFVFIGRVGAGESALSGVDYFETHVRPTLVDHCYTCHSAGATKVKGGLLLDSRPSLLKGGDSGPALVPGDPEKSLLIKAVRYADENLQMPPKKRLSQAQISALEDWVRMGAPDPRETGAPTAAPDLAENHWAFRAVHEPPLPKVHQQQWVREPVDAFVLSRLEREGLGPSPRADKRTLLRRVSFDLTGLPPSVDEVRRFVEDDSADAFEAVVERLLASPRYGERWGRYWLDVARYADTKGYVFEEERRYPYAYTYRDYVIRALNEDLPYNRFLIEQIAADQLPLGDDKRPLAALGYLTLGRRFLNNTHDIIDDRIDVVTRGMMGLTVGCARCHDHKFDPITTRDYYSLYGVFLNTVEPEDRPLLGPNDRPDLYREYLADHERRLAELDGFRNAKIAEVRGELRQRVAEYMVAAHDFRGFPADAAEALARERKLDPETVQRWIRRLGEWSQAPHHPIFGPWFALDDCSEEEPARRDTALQAAIASEGLNPQVEFAFRGPPPGSLREAAERYAALFAEATALRAGLADSSSTPLLKQADPAWEALEEVLHGPESPAAVPVSEITRLFDVPSIQKLRALKRKVEELDATHPGAPPRAMAMQDVDSMRAAHVLLRGNPARLGPEVPRQFVAVLCGGKPQPFRKGSGRLELAEAIADPNNPLTARVLVNRVWQHYFGVGLVRTPSDFGLRSDPPSHPELLDHLAARFVREGWSLKRLHRWILLSNTYQQASDDRAEGLRLDPGNQWLWKMNRRRLDFEATRDTLLAAGGQLDLSAGGHSVDILGEPFSPRRTVYGFVERQNLPGLFRTFDFATPDATSPQRFSTTVPQQALFMINSPFVIQQSLSLSHRGRVERRDAEERIRWLYQTTLQREPTLREKERGLAFIASQSSVEPYVPEPAAWQYGYGEYDPLSEKVTTFRSLPHFTGEAWQGGPSLPDAQLGWVMLRASVGHPGADHQHAAIRRWTAPRRLTITIAGKLSHESSLGDGVHAWIVSSRNGELGGWTVKKSQRETSVGPLEVDRGEILDFVVDCRQSVENDSFTWTPRIKAIAAPGDTAVGQDADWDARQEFAGPRPESPELDAWDRYVQVLLMSNEFVFVD